MYQQVFDPVSDSLALSSIFAALPLITLFVLLGGLKLKAQWAALISLAVGLLMAIVVYSMPVGQALLSGLEGAAFGIFPIMWIVVNAVWVYNMTVTSGHFAVLRRSFARISDDQRIQAVIIAFCFGALLEALAGFGTPVAICSVDAHRPRLLADQGGVGRARRQHGARGVRRDRDPDRDARRDHRPAQGGPRRHGRAPDPAARAVRAPHPRRDGRRHARASARPGRPPWPAASPSPWPSSPARTTSPSSSPTSSRRCSPSPRSSACCGCGSRPSRCWGRRTGSAPAGPPWPAGRRATRRSRRPCAGGRGREGATPPARSSPRTRPTW